MLSAPHRQVNTWQVHNQWNSLNLIQSYKKAIVQSIKHCSYVLHLQHDKRTNKGVYTFCKLYCPVLMWMSILRLKHAKTNINIKLRYNKLSYASFYFLKSYGSLWKFEAELGMQFVFKLAFFHTNITTWRCGIVVASQI